MENQFKENLDGVRSLAQNAATPAGVAKSGIKEAKLAFSLGKHLNPFIDWLFGIGLSLAILKDILDFVGIGSLPAIGTVITFCVSFLIGLIMFIVGAGGAKKAIRGMMKRFGVLAGGTGVEMFFGINFLPVETALTVAVFYMTLRDRALSAQEESSKPFLPPNGTSSDDYSQEESPLAKAA